MASLPSTFPPHPPPHANHVPSSPPPSGPRQDTISSLDACPANDLIRVDSPYGNSEHHPLYCQDDILDVVAGESSLREVSLLQENHQLISPSSSPASFKESSAKRICLHENRSFPSPPQHSESEVTSAADLSQSRSIKVPLIPAPPTLLSPSPLLHQASFSIQIIQDPSSIDVTLPTTESQAIPQESEPDSRTIKYSRLPEVSSSSSQALSHHSAPSSARSATSSTSPTRLVGSKTGKQKLSNQTRRTQEHVNIINATFARCVGKPLNDEYKRLAYPVHRSTGDVKYVLATPSDLRIVKRLQHRTEAKRAELRLTKIKISSHPRPQSCIAVSMADPSHELLGRVPATVVLAALNEKQWEYQGQPIEYDDIGSPRCKLKFGPLAPKPIKKLRPDGSIVVPGARLPFMIFEVGNTQTKEELDDKVQDWIQGCKSHIKIICVFHINDIVGAPGEYCVLMDVIRHRTTPTLRTATSFRVDPDYIIQDEEIYPRRSPASFDIHLAEVFPKDWGQPPDDDILTVKLISFYQSAKRAVRHAEAEAAARDPNHPPSSPYNSDQDEPQGSGPQTSGGSDTGSEGHAMEVDDDYEPSDDDNDDLEPRIIPTRRTGL